MTRANDLEPFWADAATQAALDAWIGAGLAEDRAQDDVTTQALFRGDDGRVEGTITAGGDGVFCGGPAALRVFRALDAALEETARAPEGSPVRRGDAVLSVRGGVQAVLGGERVALNILSHLSGIATQTRGLCEQAPGIQLLDTRKTLPGLRLFQRYAVRAGGGSNHRFDLAEMPLVKENHRDLFRARRGAAGGPAREIQEICRRLRADPASAGRVIEIEVEDLESFFACLEAGVDRVLLDNRSPEEIRTWIDAAAERGWRALPPLEASGGIGGSNVAAYARSGVSCISAGALTHSVRALDLSLHVRWADADRGREPGGTR